MAIQPFFFGRVENNKHNTTRHTYVLGSYTMNTHNTTYIAIRKYKHMSYAQHGTDITATKPIGYTYRPIEVRLYRRGRYGEVIA